ncbi:MAG: DUF2259 domain-containing protein [Candidatus Riflebacteria bacterium]|nr:DUF2259 domain-containing protein [Candidatus Riflebacteria bacterium]
MKHFFITLTFLLCVTISHAGDFAEFRSIGFSESGQYYSFAQIGIHDGSGFPYAELWVIDVLKNEQVATSSIELNDENDEAVGTVEQALKKAIEAAKLERFSIKSNENPGSDLLIHLPTDHSTFTDNVFSLEPGIDGGASGIAAKYKVILDTTETKPALKDIPTDFGPAKMLKLSIAGIEEASGTVQILQEDKRLPKSRAYPLEYSVRQVTTFKDGLVVIISYTTPGFEGPDVRYMAISGKFTPAQK